MNSDAPQRGLAVKRARTVRVLAELICNIPDEASAVLLESVWRRRTHADLVEMNQAELRRELSRVDLRLVLEDEPDEDAQTWLLDRRRWILGALDESAA